MEPAAWYVLVALCCSRLLCSQCSRRRASPSMGSESRTSCEPRSGRRRHPWRFVMGRIGDHQGSRRTMANARRSNSAPIPKRTTPTAATTVTAPASEGTSRASGRPVSKYIGPMTRA